MNRPFVLTSLSIWRQAFGFCNIFNIFANVLYLIIVKRVRNNLDNAYTVKTVLYKFELSIFTNNVRNKGDLAL